MLPITSPGSTLSSFYGPFLHPLPGFDSRSRLGGNHVANVLWFVASLRKKKTEQTFCKWNIPHRGLQEACNFWPGATWRFIVYLVAMVPFRIRNSLPKDTRDQLIFPASEGWPGNLFSISWGHSGLQEAPSIWAGCLGITWTPWSSHSPLGQ